MPKIEKHVKEKKNAKLKKNEDNRCSTSYRTGIRLMVHRALYINSNAVVLFSLLKQLVLTCTIKEDVTICAKIFDVFSSFGINISASRDHRSANYFFAEIIHCFMNHHPQ